MAGSVSTENIIENLIIAETFGNDNLEVALCGTRFAEIDASSAMSTKITNTARMTAISI